MQTLPRKLPAERMTELDRQFGLTERGNAEIAHQWLLLAIRNNYAPADARLEAYLTTIGRRKLVLPLYRALIATSGRTPSRRGDLREGPPGVSSDHGRVDRPAVQGSEVTDRRFRW